MIGNAIEGAKLSNANTEVAVVRTMGVVGEPHRRSVANAAETIARLAESRPYEAASSYPRSKARSQRFATARSLTNEPRRLCG